MTKLYLICGFLGAGKTTFSKSLAKEKDAIHLNPDEWCIKLFPNEYEQSWDKCFSKTIDLLWNKIEKYAKQGQDVVFDMGFWTKLSRDDARQKAKKLGIEPVLYYIYAPDDILQKRLAQRTGLIAQNNLKNFVKIKLSFEEPNQDEPHIKINNF